MLRYVTGDVTNPRNFGEGTHIVAHICNDIGAWGAGVSGAISRRWPEAERQYRRYYHERATQTEHGYRQLGRVWCYEHTPFQLGACQLVRVTPEPHAVWVANMIAQHGIRRRPTDPPAIDYDALETALTSLADVAPKLHPVLRDQSLPIIHMPKIGSGLAGGDWAIIEGILRERLRGLDVIVYEWVGPIATHSSTKP